MKRSFLKVLIALVGAAGLVHANQGALVVTASNASPNQLLVYSTSGGLMQTLDTEGNGGVSGNAGGIEANGEMLAVVNFGSLSVSTFQLGSNGFAMTKLLTTSTSWGPRKWSLTGLLAVRIAYARRECLRDDRACQ